MLKRLAKLVHSIDFCWDNDALLKEESFIIANTDRCVSYMLLDLVLQLLIVKNGPDVVDQTHASNDQLLR